MNLPTLAAACSLAVVAGLPAEPPDRDRAAVLAVVQHLFDAMAARDAAALSSILLPGGQLHSVREEKGQQVVRTTPFDEFTESIRSSKSRLLERMWKPVVQVFGRVATVTAPYDFHRDGAFSHCGTDVFTLVSGPEGWRIAGGVYTVTREGCQASPLGPPK